MEYTNSFLNEYFQKFDNISFLHNSFEYYEKFCFIGTTLWSKITNPIDEINDVYQIPNFNYILYNRLNMICIDFLEDALEKNDNCIIITHHGTHSLCNGHYLGSPLESGYATEIPEIFQSQNVIACINGHTHSSINLEVNGVKLLSNCYGYRCESAAIVKFNPKAVLEI